MMLESHSITALPHLRKPKFKVSWPTLLAMGTLLAWILVAILGPYIAPYDPSDFISDESFSAMSGQALLGTDYLGRDLLSRIVGGARVTLFTAFLATVLAHAVGGGLGILATVRGGYLDTILGRLVDLILSLPKIIVALVVIAAVGPSVVVLVLLTGTVYAASVFRIARALSADVAVLDFVRASRARGEGSIWLIFGEILPNIAMPLAADFALRLSFAILFVSNLSFLGLGVQPPQADWGGLVRENLSGLGSGVLAAIFPAIAIASVTISLSVLVDAAGVARESQVSQ